MIITNIRHGKMSKKAEKSNKAFILNNFEIVIRNTPNFTLV